MATAAPNSRRKPIVMLAFLGLLLAPLLVREPRSAEAHAELVGSNPAAGSALAAVPRQLSLTFSEAIDPELSSLSLVEADGSPVVTGEISVEPNDARVLLAPVIGVPDSAGVLTVVWSTYSTEDGHTSSGSFTFSVGTGEAPVQSGSSEAAVTSWAIAGKWLELIGLILLTGLAIFFATSAVPLRQSFSASAMLLAGISMVGALVSLRAREAAISGDGMVAAPHRSVVSDLLASTFGSALLARVALLALALGFAWVLRRKPIPVLCVAIGVFGFLGLATIALSGHAGAVERSRLAATIDWLHMSATAFWLGGLIGLLLVISPLVDQPGERALLRNQGNRFAFAVLVIVVAGIASAWWHIDGRRSLQMSDYGRTLLVKVALVGALLGVAYYNRRVLQGEKGRANLIPIAIGAELVLGSVILLFSADLSQTPPANQPLPLQVAARAIEVDETATAGASTVALTGILTGDPTDEISITVSPSGDLQRVIVRSQLSSTDAAEPVGDRFNAVALDEGSGTYTFPAGRLGIAGPWDLEVTVRRAGVADDIVSIPVDTSGLSTHETQVVSDSWSGFRVTPHTALALTLAGFMLVIGLGGLRRITGLEPLASGFLLAASLLIASGFLVSAARSIIPVTPDHVAVNPLDTTPALLTYAGDLYRLNCAVCHGPDGQGVGNTNAAHLHGSSADLTRGRTVEQSDGDLRYWIEHGVPGTRMPAFDPALTADEQWQLVLLIRQLQDEARREAEQE